MVYPREVKGVISVTGRIQVSATESDTLGRIREVAHKMNIHPKVPAFSCTPISVLDSEFGIH